MFLKKINTKQQLGIAADTCNLSMKFEARISLEVESKHNTLSRMGA